MYSCVSGEKKEKKKKNAILVHVKYFVLLIYLDFYAFKIVLIL